MDAPFQNPAARGIGDNKPPATIADDLAERFKEHLDRHAELIEAGHKAPETIGDDETHKKVVELAKEMRSLELVLENNRELEREPHKKMIDAVNGWFKSRIDPLETLRKKLQQRHKEYSERKAAEEKRRIEEEAERKRQAEREALRLASEASATRIISDQASADAKQLADEAKASREAATSDLEIATADAADARAKSAAIWAKLLAIDADHARRRKAGETIPGELATAEKGDLPDQLKAAKAAVAAADEALKKAREAAAEAKRKQQEADRQAEEAKRTASAAKREEQAHLGDAIRADKSATKLEERASGPAADLARVRSEHGAVGTLQRQWQSRIVDRAKLDKNALWPFIHEDAIAAALWKWMMAQPAEKRVMAGAAISEETIGTVR